MKKLAFGLLAICMVVLLVVSLNGGFDDVENNNIKFNEAAFTMPSSVTGATDATAFLVGEFDGEDGSHISVDGKGNIRVTKDGLTRSGRYALRQQPDLSAMIQFSFEDGDELYVFSLVSEIGEFSLTDDSGKSVKYTPVII
ncbi:MAG: hypothetical protein IJV74_04430 [Clostridia bacterium]|nr:hypothetical protein [Oscillospiraceae bacterium]MBQ9733463.1 hypothetical protein [Clostridia bacterium]